MRIIDIDRKQADVILSLLNRMIDVYVDSDAVFEKDTFDNGREHGYIIYLVFLNGTFVESKDRFYIAFAENRSSDDTVVYYGHGSLCLSNRKLFAYEDFILVAEYIKSLMIRNIEKLESVNYGK